MGSPTSLGSRTSETRTIVSGIAQFYQPEEIIGKQVPVVMNLAPRIIKGIESQGMVLMAVSDGAPTLIAPIKNVAPGSPVQ